MMQHDLQESNPNFGANKIRRKAYRQRPADVNKDSDDNSSNVDTWIDMARSFPQDVHPDSENAIQPTVTSNILRKRQKNRRIGGVEFKANAPRARSRENLQVEAQEVTPEGLVGVKSKLRKFSRQTGAVEDVDRHMMAYIESELAKRSSQGLQDSSKALSRPPQVLSLTCAGETRASTYQNEKGASKTRIEGAPRQPATLGLLQEIDLGDEVRERNVKMTERATRKLDGELTDDEDNVGRNIKLGSKARIGKDGKSWWERKKRRYDDIKRDQLVDQVLRENRLEIYDKPIDQASHGQNGQAADDRIAEDFRREFMDSVSARHRKKATQAQSLGRGASGKKDEVLKGPKLGGSRSARAAVRETLLKNSKK